MNCVRMNGLPMPSTPKIEPLLLDGDDALQVHRAGLDHHADDREQQRQLVGDELRGGAQRAEQRELVGARPAGHEHADDREARHRQRVEHADVEVLDDEVGPGRDHEEDEERRDHDDDGRERRRRAGRPRAGMMSSFWMNLMPSPTSWNQPWNPPGSIGPSRLCMWLIILSRNT